jgi:O-antigen/teichoic acid export membrane protein
LWTSIWKGELLSLSPDAKENGSSAPAESTYGQILKSSALIGASSAITIVISLVRTKVMALLLGPSGFGLLSLFGSIVELAVAVASMGINNSGVRQIAEAAGSEDARRTARTAKILRYTAIVLGIIGAVLVLVLCRQASILTFGTDQHAGAIAILSCAVLFQLVAASQAALVQGLRRILDLAKMSVLGALLGTVVSIPLVYYLKQDGVAPAVVGIALMLLITSWWYSRKVELPATSVTYSEARDEVTLLLKLGAAFMASNLFMMGAAYTVRIILVRNIGLDAAGLYAAAWTLGGLYAGFILQAMGADFYPRLVGVANDNKTSTRIVNEQVQISMLLAGPGVIGTLVFAPIVLHILYSADFAEAVGTLRWICLGVALRVVTWPMGFIVIAKRRQLLFFCLEASWATMNVGLAWLLVDIQGVDAAGMAFFLAYAVHGLALQPVARSLIDYRWSPASTKIIVVYASSIAFAFLSQSLLPTWLAITLGIIVLLLSSIFSIRTILVLLPDDALPAKFQAILVWLRETGRRLGLV